MNNFGGIREKLRKEIKSLENILEIKKRELNNLPLEEFEKYDGKYFKSKNGFPNSYIFIKKVTNYSNELNVLKFKGIKLSFTFQMMGSNYFFDLNGGSMELDTYEEITKEKFDKVCNLAVKNIQTHLESINENKI